MGDTYTLSAVNLPTGVDIAVTYTPYPVGGGFQTQDGTYSFTRSDFPIAVTPPEAVTAYFWTRGKGKSLIKPGPQLGGFHITNNGNTVLFPGQANFDDTTAVPLLTNDVIKVTPTLALLH